MLKKLDQLIDEKISVGAALLSCLTLFIFLRLQAPQWYQMLPLGMKEIVCGLSTWSAYPKQSDLYMMEASLACVLISFMSYATLGAVIRHVILIRKNGAVFHAKQSAGSGNETNAETQVATKSKIKIQAKLAYVQLLFPLVFLQMIHFRYLYEAENLSMELFYSKVWKLACLALTVLLMVTAFYQIRFKKQVLTYSTFLSFAGLLNFIRPEGIMSIDYFHNGEFSLPMYELKAFHKLPFKGLIPIHGLCDYYYGLINELFFDGSYLSINAAKCVGNVFLALFLAGIMYFFIRNKWHGLLMVIFVLPFMIQNAGIRYVFFFTMFLVLFSDEMDSAYRFCTSWVFLSILAIAWNASIGGALAAGFLPLAVFRLIQTGKEEFTILFRAKDKKKMTVLVLLILFGLAFIPLFLQIVSYLKDNAGTTLLVNSMEMIEKSSGIEGFLTLAGEGQLLILGKAFGFLLSVLILLIMGFGRQNQKAKSEVMTVVFTLLILFQYAFVRYDEGLRAMVLGAGYMAIALITILFDQLRKNGKWQVVPIACYLVGIVFFFWVSGGWSPKPADILNQVKLIPKETEITIMGKEVSDPVVYVRSDSVNIGGIGSGFISGNALANLQNIQMVLNTELKEGEQYYNATNEVALDLIFQKESILPYTSVYNISNRRMQEDAIERLRANMPTLILLSPNIVFDDASFSYRSPQLYQFFLQEGYQPYKYENVLYLMKREAVLATANWEEYAKLLHKTNIEAMPVVWGANLDDMKEGLKKAEIGCEITRDDKDILIRFNEPISPGEHCYMVLENDGGYNEPDLYKKIFAQREMDSDENGAAIDDSANVKTYQEMTLSWENPFDSEAKVSYHFAKGGRLMIPIGLTPYALGQGIREFRLETGDDIVEPSDIHISFYHE